MASAWRLFHVSRRVILDLTHKQGTSTPKKASTAPTTARAGTGPGDKCGLVERAGAREIGGDAKRHNEAASEEASGPIKGDEEDTDPDGAPVGACHVS